MALADVLSQWRSNGSEYLVKQLDNQLATLGTRLNTSGTTLSAIAKQLGDDPNLAIIAPLVSDGAGRVERFSESLVDRDVRQWWVDAEAFAYKQPVLAALVAAAVGFSISRAVKASTKPPEPFG